MTVQTLALLLLVLAGSPMGLQGQATSPKDDETLQSEILWKARKSLTSGNPQGAIDEHIDNVIKFYETKYKDEKRRIYCTRTPTENLYYLLIAANEKVSAVAYACLWPDAHYMKAYAFLELGKLQDAKKSLQAALDLAPRNSQYLAELAHCYQLEKNWQKALELFELAEESAKSTSPEGQKVADLGRALRGQGYALVETGKLDEAEKKYQECLKINPQDKSARDELNFIKKQRGAQ
jgi:tetratricopeptide (TPR) repeat protein